MARLLLSVPINYLSGITLTTRRLLTFHAPMSLAISTYMLANMKESLLERGITRWWISHDELPDIVIMAEVPDDFDITN